MFEEIFENFVKKTKWYIELENEVYQARALARTYDKRRYDYKRAIKKIKEKIVNFERKKVTQQKAIIKEIRNVCKKTGV